MVAAVGRAQRFRPQPPARAPRAWPPTPPRPVGTKARPPGGQWRRLERQRRRRV